MTTTSSSNPVTPADALLQDIQAQSEEIFREVTQLLNDTPDEKLFGDTEFLVRDKILQIVGRLYQARVNQKKTATTAPVSNAPTASE